MSHWLGDRDFLGADPWCYWKRGTVDEKHLLRDEDIDIHEREGDQAPPKWKETIFPPDSLFKGKLLAVFGYV